MTLVLEHPPRIAPGPRGVPVLGDALVFRRDPRLAVLRWTREYGPVVRFRLGPLVGHVVSHPGDVKHVLVDNNQNYRKAPRMDFLTDFLGRSLLTMEGDPWMRRRRLAQPAFHKERLAQLGDVIADGAERLVERWRPLVDAAPPFDVAAEMMRVTLGIVGEALFGVDLGPAADEVGLALPLVLDHIMRRMTSVVPLPLSLPTPANHRYHAATRSLDALVDGFIRGWRDGRVPPAGLMAMLMEARDEETGCGLTDRELRDEAMTMIFAGHETTSNALTWTWWLLAQNPGASRRLGDELETVLDGRPPRAADLPRLRYTCNVVQEAMRLMPPSWVIGRMPLEDDVIGGYHIPAGSMVLLAPCVTHRDPSLWEDPDAFDPDRFTPERSAGRHRLAYYPFSAGQRGCIGNNFSLMESTLIVAAVAQRYRLALDPTRPVVIEPSLTLRPKSGLWMTLHPAEGTRAAGVPGPAAAASGPAQSPRAPLPGALSPRAPLPGALSPRAPLPGALSPRAPLPGALSPRAPLPGALLRHAPSRVATARTGKSYLVVGGHGMLGSHIVEALLARGEETIRVFDIAPSPLFDDEVRRGVVSFHHGSILDGERLGAACRGVDTVFHTVASVNYWADLPFEYDGMHAVNVSGTRSVIDACVAAGVAELLHTSSTSVVVPRDLLERPLALADESTPYPTAPFLCHYVHTKGLAERAALAANGRGGLLTAALRPGGMYGPRDALITAGVASGAPGAGGAANVVDHIYVENVVHAFLLLEAKLAPGSPSSTVAGQAYFVTNYAPAAEPGRCATDSYFEFYTKFAARFGHRFRLAPPRVMEALAWASQALVLASRGKLERRLGDLGKLRPATLTLARGTHYFTHAKATRDFGYQPLYSVGEAMDITARHWQRAHAAR